MTATEALDYLRTQGITLHPAGKTLRVSPRHLITPEVSELIQTYKPDLLTLLTTESGASSRAVEPAAQQREESHVPGAADTHALVALLPGLEGPPSPVVATIPEAQRLFYAGTVAYVSYEVRLLAGYRASYPDHFAALVRAVQAAKCKGGVVIELYPPDAERQVKFSYYPPAPAPDLQAPQPPTVPASTPAQAALPLGSGVPHGEVVPTRRRI